MPFPRDPNSPDNERPLRSIHDRVANPWGRGIAPMFGPVQPSIEDMAPDPLAPPEWADDGTLDSLGNLVQDGGRRLSPSDPFEQERSRYGL